MAGSVDYWAFVDRDNGNFDMQINYFIPAYNDPETGESFYDTSWTYDYYDYGTGMGGGSGGYGSEGDSVMLSLGMTPGEDVTRARLSFSAMNSFSGESAAMVWQIWNAALATTAKTISGTSGADIILTGGGADLLQGGNGNDYLDSGAGNDRLEGGAGADWLDGGSGDDVMVGGAGDDLYIVESAADALVEIPGGGIDSVVSFSNYVLPAFVDNLALVGSGAVDGKGNAQSNIIYGNALANSLAGLGGNDALFGYDGDDILHGGSGHDLLDGGAGADRLIGGYGDDLYIVNNSNDTIIEWQDQGLDAVLVVDGASYTLSDNVEGLTNYSSQAVFRGVGNAGANILAGGTYVDQLFGLAGDDALYGDDGDDVLEGGDGGDLIDGGNGSDTASFAGSGQAVQVNLAMGTGSYGDAEGDLYYAIENLVGSAFNDHLTGDDSANIIRGGDGRDRIYGGAGNDKLFGGDDHDWIEGGDGKDWLQGGAGADHLDGGKGSNTISYADSDAGVTVNLKWQTARGGHASGDAIDGFTHAEGSAWADHLIGGDFDNLLIGGAGDDVLEGGYGSDTLRGGAGADRIDGGQGLDMLDYTGSSQGVTVNLATRTASGGDADGDIFTQMDGVIGTHKADVITGNARANILIGGIGDDRLYGGSGDDLILGGRGSDYLHGGSGIDTLSYADASGSVSILLTAGQGSTLFSWDSGEDRYIGFENLVGGDYGDWLHGDDHNNDLTGGGGHDTLSGGGGADRFIFDSPLGAGNVDTILDFITGEDVIKLSGGFLGLRPISPDSFRIGTQAMDADDQLIYDDQTGALWFDADGNGSGAAIQFAMLTGARPLSYSDIVII